jgi:hypothetical protein
MENPHSLNAPLKNSIPNSPLPNKRMTFRKDPSNTGMGPITSHYRAKTWKADDDSRKSNPKIISKAKKETESGLGIT